MSLKLTTLFKLLIHRESSKLSYPPPPPLVPPTAQLLLPVPRCSPLRGQADSFLSK